MNERFGPNTFERLEQGSEARILQIKAARGITDDEILVLDNPQTTFFSKLKEGLSRSFKPVRGRVAVPVGMLILTIAAACSGGGKDKRGEVGGSEDFSDNLPVELIDTCRLYVESDLRDTDVGEGELSKGLIKAGLYVYQNPDDARGLYLVGVGTLFNFEIGLTRDLLIRAVDQGLPQEQEKLAENVVANIDRFMNGDKSKQDAAKVVIAMDDIAEDLEQNICPEGKIGGSGVGGEESVISAEETEIRGLIACGLDSDGGCLNRLLELHEKSLPIMLKEILSNDVEHEYIPSGTSRPIMNILDLLTVTLYRLDENYPEEVNGVVDNVISVLECLTVSPCNEIDIGSEKIKVESGDIDSPIGRNSIAFLNTFAFYYYSSPAGKNFILPYIDRLTSIQQWVEQRESSANEYGLISYDLIVLISDLQE